MYRLLVSILLLFLIGCQEQVLIPSQFSQQDKGLVRPVPPVQARIKKRVALVIGNADYKFAPLRNPVNDAKDMAKALRSVNFHVIYKTNASWTEMDDGIEEFSGLLGKGVVGLFYFSGHGVQLEDKNYLLPTDMEKPSIRKVKHRSISASYVLTAMNGAGNTMNILILDACRDNPFKGLSKSIGIGKGLARMKDVPTGTLIAYATSPGDTAADGDGRNSPYTAGLLANLHQPNLPIEMMFKQVRNAVLQNTGNRQTPWESSSLKGENFYFVKKKTVVASASDTPPVVPVVPIPTNTGQYAEIARLKREKAEAEARAERERQARIAAENSAKQDARKQAEIERIRRKKARIGNTPAPEVDQCALDDDNDWIGNCDDNCPGTKAGSMVDNSGCTIVKPVRTVSFQLEIKFASGKAFVHPDYFYELQRVADTLSQNPNATVEIAGHTDSRGRAHNNKRLSQRRADAVRDTLIAEFGADGSRITAIGYGEEHPIADNSTSEGRAKNKRVIVTIQ